MLLNLNAVMSIIANVPAAIASTVSFVICHGQGMSYSPTYVPDCCLPGRSPINQLYLARSRSIQVSFIP